MLLCFGEINFIGYLKKKKKQNEQVIKQRKSTNVYCTFFGENLVIVEAKYQNVDAPCKIKFLRIWGYGNSHMMSCEWRKLC